MRACVRAFFKVGARFGEGRWERKQGWGKTGLPLSPSGMPIFRDSSAPRSSTSTTPGDDPQQQPPAAARPPQPDSFRKCSQKGCRRPAKEGRMQCQPCIDIKAKYKAAAKGEGGRQEVQVRSGWEGEGQEVQVRSGWEGEGPTRGTIPEPKKRRPTRGLNPEPKGRRPTRGPATQKRAKRQSRERPKGGKLSSPPTLGTT